MDVRDQGEIEREREEGGGRRVAEINIRRGTLPVVVWW